MNTKDNAYWKNISDSGETPVLLLQKRSFRSTIRSEFAPKLNGLAKLWHLFHQQI